MYVLAADDVSHSLSGVAVKDPVVYEDKVMRALFERFDTNKDGTINFEVAMCPYSALLWRA